MRRRRVPVSKESSEQSSTVMRLAVCLSSVRVGASRRGESFRSSVLMRILLTIQHLLHERPCLLLV